MGDPDSDDEALELPVWLAVRVRDADRVAVAVRLADTPTVCDTVTLGVRVRLCVAVPLLVEADVAVCKAVEVTLLERVGADD